MVPSRSQRKMKGETRQYHTKGERTTPISYESSDQRSVLGNFLKTHGKRLLWNEDSQNLIKWSRKSCWSCVEHRKKKSKLWHTVSQKGSENLRMFIRNFHLKIRCWSSNAEVLLVFLPIVGKGEEWKVLWRKRTESQRVHRKGKMHSLRKSGTLSQLQKVQDLQLGQILEKQQHKPIKGCKYSKQIWVEHTEVTKRRSGPYCSERTEQEESGQPRMDARWTQKNKNLEITGISKTRGIVTLHMRDYDRYTCYMPPSHLYTKSGLRGALCTKQKQRSPHIVGLQCKIICMVLVDNRCKRTNAGGGGRQLEPGGNFYF